MIYRMTQISMTLSEVEGHL